MEAQFNIDACRLDGPNTFGSLSCHHSWTNASGVVGLPTRMCGPMLSSKRRCLSCIQFISMATISWCSLKEVGRILWT